MLYETFGQHFAVELLENILVFYVLEHDHLEKNTAFTMSTQLNGSPIKSATLKSNKTLSYQMLDL